MYEGVTHSWKENGIDFFVRFTSTNFDMPQWTIVPSDIDPLTGENMTIIASTV